jgi:hypothetical protein
MLGTMMFMLLAGIVVGLWFDALAARELAGAHARRLCQEAGLQLLDQSVALQRWTLGRGPNGRLGAIRRYAFEVSFDGTDRHPGTISFIGRARSAYTLPLRESPMQRDAIAIDLAT